MYAVGSEGVTLQPLNVALAPDGAHEADASAPVLHQAGGLLTAEEGAAHVGVHDLIEERPVGSEGLCDAVAGQPMIEDAKRASKLYFPAAFLLYISATLANRLDAPGRP